MIQLIKSIIYGLISGFTEIVPVSARGHQALLMRIFGMEHRDPVLDLFTHIGILVSICIFYNTEIRQFIAGTTGSAKVRRGLNKQTLYDIRLLKAALIPTVFVMFFYNLGRKIEFDFLLLALFMIINGIILFFPDYLRQGNKNASLLGRFDSALLGLSSIAAIIPGISRIGAGLAISISRGADKHNALKWMILLTIPAIACLIILDIIGLFTLGLTPLTIFVVLGYLLAALAAFAGCYLGIMLCRFISINSGFSGFAFYSWGAAIFTFLIYLIAF